jgi:hypothetical protein
VFAGSRANYPPFRHLFPEGSVTGFVQFIGTGGMPVATGGAASPPSSERAGTARARRAPRTGRLAALNSPEPGRLNFRSRVLNASPDGRG